MRKNYFPKIIKHTKDVYNIDRSLKRITDGRINPTYKTHQVILPELLGFILRIRSSNELNNMIAAEEFKNILKRGMKSPKIDAIRDALKVVDISILRDILKHGINKARDNKVLDNWTIDGYMVAAIDGTLTI